MLLMDIEVHGYDEAQFYLVKEDIVGALKGCPYLKDVILIMGSLISESLVQEGRELPFLRVVHDNNQHVDDLIRRLRALDEDVEDPVRGKFYPRNEELDLLIP